LQKKCFINEIHQTNNSGNINSNNDSSFVSRLVYRNVVIYKSLGQRQNYLATDKKLVQYFEANTSDKKDTTIKYIIRQSLSATSQKLNFTASNNDTDPNKLINSKTAHCVGYASFFSTTCNYLLHKNNLSKNWVAKPQIGQLYFFGTNIHKYFSSTFFKDHDFVTIENKTTGEIFNVDATVNDYLGIDFITFKK
jgi:hypothetical protein